MNAYRKYIVIGDPKHVVLDDLPFRTGQRVEVVVLADDRRELLADEMRALFAEIRALPGADAITSEDIAREIADYRAGR